MARRLCVFAAILAAVAELTVVPQAEAASQATVTYRIRGTVACPSGQPVVGVWMQSSGGGSGFMTWTAYPGAPTIARFSSPNAFKFTLGSSIHLNVGCGGTPTRWGSSSRGPSITVKSGSMLYMNAECNGSTCSTFPMENNTPAAPSTNPGADSKQCTWRAALYWKEMTGRYPNWNGNAGYWDDNAAKTGWAVRSWPRPDSIFVRQPKPNSKTDVGHVGWVSDTRVEGGKLQMRIYDRNSDWRGSDRDGVWIDFVSGMKFIVAPARSGTMDPALR